MSKANNKVLQKQKLYFYIIIGILCSFVFLKIVLRGGGESSQNIRKQRNIELPTDKIDLQTLNINQIQEDNKLLRKELSLIKKSALSDKKDVESLVGDSRNIKKEIFNLRENISFQPGKASSDTSTIIIEKEIKKPQQQQQQLIQGFQSDIDLFKSSITPKASKEKGVVAFMPSSSIADVTIKEITDINSLPNVDNSIPAGVSVRAILVSSLDAACGVSSSSNPYPVKLRIIDDGKLPKSVISKIKGGIIIGNGFGDLSSERVYIRAERLTLPYSNGDYVETEVAGYISGEDGKYGVRGVVVDRSGKLIASAAYSGFFSGISQFLQATIQAQNISEASVGLPNDLRLDILKSSGIEGTTGALDKVAEYYIKRAEQVQPIVQIAAGRTVDVTFTHGVKLGEVNTKRKIKKLREKSFGK